MWNYQYLSVFTYKNWQPHVIQPNICHQGSYLISLNLSFLMCKMKTIATSQVNVKIKLNLAMINVIKAL